MPRMRTIKPEFFANDELGALGPTARLLFAGLWCWADREGRLEDRPARLKAQILPYDTVDADQLLEQLAVCGFIIRYQSGDLRLIQVVTFVRHQNPHRAEKRSIFPPPGEQADSTPPAPGKNGADPVPAPKKARTRRAGHESWAMGHGVPAMGPQDETAAHDSLSVADSDDSVAAAAEVGADGSAPEREATRFRSGRGGPARRRALMDAFERVDRWRTPANSVELAQRVAAARALDESTPPVTPEEVGRLVDRWDRDHDPALLTPMALPRNLTQLRGPPATPTGRRRGAPFRDDRSAAEKAREPVRAWHETWSEGDASSLKGALLEQQAGGGSA